MRHNPLYLKIKSFIQGHTLLCILICAGILRLVTALFAKGYAMHDDHFCVIEVAFDWLTGRSAPSADPDSLRNLIYVGFHYLFLKGLWHFRITDPQTVMTILRIVHALYSLLLVVYAYRIAALVHGKAAAALAGWLCALFWIMPFMSVRNLVEMVCIPPLMIGVYEVMRYDRNRSWKAQALAGACLGLAFVLRYQTAPFIAVLLFPALLRRQWVQLSGIAAGGIAVTVLALGIPEWIVYGAPFFTIKNYLLYNSNSASIAGYPIGPWYMYTGTIAGGLVPPASLLLLWAFGVRWNKYASLFWPAMAFIVFHSLYPNKQERFIFPVLPFILVEAAVGWQWIKQRYSVRPGTQKLFRYLWVWFWVFNSALMLIGTVTYSKKTRVESMYYFFDKKNVHSIIVEDREGGVPFLPHFYAGRHLRIFELPGSKPIDSLREELAREKNAAPQAVVFFGQGDMDRRISRVRELFPTVRYRATVSPSFMDDLLYRVNPENNFNQTSAIYAIDSPR